MLSERFSKIWQRSSKIFPIVRFYHSNFYIFIFKFWNLKFYISEVAKTVHVPYQSVSPNSYIINNGTITKSGNWYWYKACVVRCHFISCVDSCNHHHNQDTELFHQHNDLLPATTYSHMHPSLLPPPISLATNNRRSSICIILPFWKCYINGIIQYGPFEISFLHSTKYPWDRSKLLCVTTVHFPSLQRLHPLIRVSHRESFDEVQVIEFFSLYGS